MMAAKIQFNVYEIYVDMSKTPCRDVHLCTMEEYSVLELTPSVSGSKLSKRPSYVRIV